MAIEGVEIFARLGRPGANAALGTADFEDIRDVRTRGNAPIETIAAKIGQTPAATDILLQCVKRVRCVVFGVRSGHHRAIRPQQCCIIELGICLFEYDRQNGRIYRVLDSWEWLEDPGLSIPPEITNITGITDEMVGGHRIDDRAVNDLLGRVVLVIAHNADFDRRFLEKRLPAFATKHWACRRFDIDWKAEGIRSSALEFVAYSLGFFHDGHRAASDCRATLHVISIGPADVLKKAPLFKARALERAQRIKPSRDTNKDGPLFSKAEPAQCGSDQRHAITVGAVVDHIEIDLRGRGDLAPKSRPWLAARDTDGNWRNRCPAQGGWRCRLFWNRRDCRHGGYGRGMPQLRRRMFSRPAVTPGIGVALKSPKL
jgi:DNA polymerase III epsilon subunit-like protein